MNPNVRAAGCVQVKRPSHFHAIPRHAQSFRAVGATQIANRKAERVRISKELLQRHQQEEVFLHRIVAINKTWVRSYEPELKRQNAE